MRDALRKDILLYVTEKRYPHILGTEEECLRLAEIFSFSESEREELGAAALLHDITKRFNTDEHIKYMKSIGKQIPKSNLKCDKTLHALTGAYFAREKYPELVNDRIFFAIYYHTTGKGNMSLFEKLLYLADYIEPTRTFDDCVKVRERFYNGIKNAKNMSEKLNALDDTLLFSLDLTVDDLKRRGRLIHPDTMGAREYLIKNSAEACASENK